MRCNCHHGVGGKFSGARGVAARHARGRRLSESSTRQSATTGRDGTDERASVADGAMVPADVALLTPVVGSPAERRVLPSTPNTGSDLP